MKFNDKPLAPNKTQQKRSNLSKVEWIKYENYLNDRSLEYSDLYDEDLTPQTLNNRFSRQILEAAEIAIPIANIKTGNELPESIICLIRQRRALMKNLKISSNANLKISSNANLRISYNRLSSEIRKNINEHKENTWQKFLDKHGSHPVPDRPKHQIAFRTLDMRIFWLLMKIKKGNPLIQS